MPERIEGIVRDTVWCGAFAEAVSRAVKAIEERAMEPRVLCLGSKSALLPMVSLRSGAKHVAVAERYQASSSLCPAHVQ